MAIPAARKSGKASFLGGYVVAHVKIKILMTRKIVRIYADNSGQQVVSLCLSSKVVVRGRKI